MLLNTYVVIISIIVEIKIDGVQMLLKLIKFKIEFHYFKKKKRVEEYLPSYSTGGLQCSLLPLVDYLSVSSAGFPCSCINGTF